MDLDQQHISETTMSGSKFKKICRNCEYYDYEKRKSNYGVMSSFCSKHSCVVDGKEDVCDMALMIKRSRKSLAGCPHRQPMEERKAIKQQILESRETAVALSSVFGYSAAHIGLIRRGKQWKDV